MFQAKEKSDIKDLLWERSQYKREIIEGHFGWRLVVEKKNVAGPIF